MSERPYALGAEMIPRRLRVGPVMLDLFHRDGLAKDRWIGLHPREFQVLWRLAETPARSVTRHELLKQVWRLQHDPQTNSVEVHISRLRTKLARFGLDWLVATDPEGGYHISGQALVSAPAIRLGPRVVDQDYLILQQHAPGSLADDLMVQESEVEP